MTALPTSAAAAAAASPAVEATGACASSSPSSSPSLPRCYWIVADMDGTLTPTPSKAHGRYLSLSEAAAIFGGCENDEDSSAKTSPRVPAGTGDGDTRADDCSAGVVGSSGSSGGGGESSRQQQRPDTERRYFDCLTPLREALSAGVNLCVVSTAGKRMWRQLYPDLAPSLYPAWTRCSSAAANGGGNSPNSAPFDLSVSGRRGRRLPGRLLLCGFTGAALFASRPSRDPVIQAFWREQKEATGMREGVGAPYPPAEVAMAEDVGYRRSAAGATSPCAGDHDCTHVPPQCPHAPAAAEDTDSPTAAPTPCLPSSPSGTTTMSAGAAAVAEAEGRAALLRFLEHVSGVCGYREEAARAFLSGCLSAKYHAPLTALLARAWAELGIGPGGGGGGSSGSGSAADDASASGVAPGHTVSLSLEAAPSLAPGPLREYGRYLTETHDALVDVQRVPAAAGAGGGGGGAAKGSVDEGPIAQITILAIPMRYFSLVFRPDGEEGEEGEEREERGEGKTAAPPCLCSREAAARGRGALRRLAAAGLVVKAQPNSVCIHRAGIDKATCVRWLAAHPHRYTASATSAFAASAAADGDGGQDSSGAEEVTTTRGPLLEGKSGGLVSVSAAAAAPGALPADGFRLCRAVALGDVPASVDRPLASFYPPMLFVSLSPRADDGLPPVPPPPSAPGDTPVDKGGGGGGGSIVQGEDAAVRAAIAHVGGEEEGTGAFLRELLRGGRHHTETGEERWGEEWLAEARVRRCAERARALLEARAAARQRRAGGLTPSFL